MASANDPQKLFKRGAYLDQQRWIAEELQRPLESAIGLDIEVEITEEPSTTQYKNYRPGRHFYHYTFTDGTQHTFMEHEGEG